ncbi:DEKNAAC100995 [Brettanomyces naardenensis]|uniref:Mitochondrial escape protein 2 n=1 Tax=Brettanomyces naardenensis TaxID=13370 RepID=A0A448YGT1_BRENA|nr:DEKNAAC100995 [Brettanomyces naardenensis]
MLPRLWVCSRGFLSPLRTIPKPIISNFILHPSSRFITEEALLKSSNLGEDDDVDNTGFIPKDMKESLLYYDRLLPMKSSKWDMRQLFLPLFYDVSEAGLKKHVMSLSQGEGDAKLPLKITQFTPVRRDGGAFVKFRVPDNTDVSDFNKQLMQNVADHAHGRLLDRLTHPRCFAVKGVPWIEDLARYPSPKLSVEFEGPDLTQENLYALFRRYGAISDIDPPAPDSKAVPRHAIVLFRNTRAAVSARQCLNGLQAGKTTLHIQYERIVKVNFVSQFIGEHSRIFIPIFLAILAGIAVIIFDPIRHFFITEKITSAYSFQKSKFYKNLVSYFTSTKRRMSQIISRDSSFGEDDLGWNSIEGMKAEREEMAKNIRLCIEENVNSFIVVQGPAGSGKRSLVQDQALKDRPNVLYIDCEHIIKSRKENDFIKNTANELGYTPVFPWLTSVSSFTDLVMQGLTGQKSGLSETKETQVKNILTLAADAIRDLALKNYHLADDGEHHLKEEDYLRQNPDAKPVIVIDRFQSSRNGRDSNAFIYSELAEWAANLVTLDFAHVIFITDDIGSVQKLASVMPSAPLKRTILSDASSAASETYVVNMLTQPVVGADGEKSFPEKMDTTDLFAYTDKLGGRMLDLQMFVRRIQSGDSPKEAFEGLVRQSIEQLTQTLMQPEENGFDRSQVWCLIKLLAKTDDVSFTDIQKLPLFKVNGYVALQNIENAEVVLLIRDKGVIQKVKPAKPLYGEAFREMIADKSIYNSMESDYLKTLISQETAKVSKMEDEVARFQGVEESRLFKDRLQYLAGKIAVSTQLISKWEKEMAALTLDTPKK